MDYKKVEGLPAIPDFGMLFTLPVDYDQIKYYGLGPCDNYIDRKEGGKLGIFTTTTQDEIQPYLVPQECGNHCDVRWFEVTDRRGRGVRIFLQLHLKLLLFHTIHMKLKMLDIIMI